MTRFIQFIIIISILSISTSLRVFAQENSNQEIKSLPILERQNIMDQRIDKLVKENLQLKEEIQDMQKNGVPAGTILPFGGNKLPEGFLFCNGSPVSRTTYADLFAAIKTAWGEGDGKTTFDLPDLRGVFLRGRDNGSNMDPGAALRTASKTGKIIGDNVGSIQKDSIKKHRHLTGAVSGKTDEYNGQLQFYNANGGLDTFIQAGKQKQMEDGDNKYDDYKMFTKNGNFYSDDSVLSSNDKTETRPLNVSVNYIIKY
ncbi:MAG: tail fiber protein [Desulfamplus sp.]